MNDPRMTVNLHLFYILENPTNLYMSLLPCLRGFSEQETLFSVCKPNTPEIV